MGGKNEKLSTSQGVWLEISQSIQGSGVNIPNLTCMIMRSSEQRTLNMALT